MANEPVPAGTPAAPPAAPAAPAAPAKADPRFQKDMTIGTAMRLHPRAAEVFMGFHLGGCSHCAIAEDEVIEQVCMGYGIPVDMLLNALNSLFEYDRKRAEAAKAAQAKAAQPAPAAPATPNP